MKKEAAQARTRRGPSEAFRRHLILHRSRALFLFSDLLPQGQRPWHNRTPRAQPTAVFEIGPARAADYVARPSAPIRSENRKKTTGVLVRNRVFDVKISQDMTKVVTLFRIFHPGSLRSISSISTKSFRPSVRLRLLIVNTNDAEKTSQEMNCVLLLLSYVSLFPFRWETRRFSFEAVDLSEKIFVRKGIGDLNRKARRREKI